MEKKYSFLAKILSVVLLFGFSTGCQKFLDEAPSKTSSLVVKTTAQLEALLNAINTFRIEYSRAALFGSDDYGLTPTLYNARPATFSYMPTIHFMLWDSQYVADDNNENNWEHEYKKIFVANLALNNLDGVTGTESEKATIKADAHFIRAYSYWNLVNTYCLPYTEQNKNEPGLPLKLGVGFDEGVGRQTIERVYQQIESDLVEALKTPVSLTESGRARHWRASKEGVNAFAARFYLNRNNNLKALEHANAALADYNTLVDYNTDMSYAQDEKITINPGTANAQVVTLRYPYTRTNQTDLTDMLGWKEFLYFRMMTNAFSWYVPSQELLGLYDQTNDLRYAYHYVEGFSYSRGMTNPSFDYPGYVFFHLTMIPSGPTVAEVLLTRAEAQARLNNLSSAMATINILRAKRMKAGPWVNLSAINQADAVKKVLQERRREMPFVQRWIDIRRYNNNDDPSDDVILTKEFYPFNGSSVINGEALKTYTLPKNSRRYAAPIPTTEVVSSNGAIEQNTY